MSSPLQRDPPFGVLKHVPATEAKPPDVVDRRGRSCGVACSTRALRCNLPTGHGGVHAFRTEKPRSEASVVGAEVWPDLPTTVYKTVFTWRRT